MRFLFGFLLVLMVQMLGAQTASQPSYVPGEVLVRLPDGKDLSTLLADMRGYGLRPVKHISPSLNIWQLQFDTQLADHASMLEALRLHPLVRAAQNNHYLEHRATTPNDVAYPQQWQYDNSGAGGGTPNADIDAPEAWDITTGGLTPLGDTIVVCVVDDGLDQTHTDFAGNVWVNYGEIPNNGQDDDGNGYVDDYRGWNINSDNDNIAGGGFFGGNHGTPVAGIVGARGNNGIGVAGVNWQVKLMIVVGGGNEASAIESYEYPLVQRRLYNQSGGSQGAFVVATNSSWGVDNLQWTNAPLWCAFYDSLGVQGIISAGATANNEVNVDVVGDMPTSCPSPYLISVTNLNRTGNKQNPAGYGLTSIDLGAFGADTYTTAKGNTYGGFGGTSGATPHVAGAIALLYSAPCPAFAALAQADPEAAGLAVRNIILQSVKPNPSLVGISVTAGTLNLKNALDSMMNFGCSMAGCYAPFGLAANNISGNAASLRWWGVPASDFYDLRYRELGTSTWTTVTATDTFLTLNGLTACTEYEVQIMTNCGGSQSPYSNLYKFKTGDCCPAPTSITVSNISPSTAQFAWTGDAFVTNYTVEYKKTTESFWDLTSTVNTGITINGLDSCTEYQVRMISTCPVNVNNQYSNIVTFKTKGCGACEDLSYCASKGNDASYEWISNVSLGTLNNSSASNNGYADFTGQNAPLLPIGEKAYLSVSVGRSQPSSVNIRVWIDYNQNGAFGADEKVYERLSFSGNTTGDSIAIPVTALGGITRMRVSMRYNQSQTECQTFNYGEVEDYCLFIDGPLGSSSIADALATQSLVFPNPVEDELTIRLQSPQSQSVDLRLADVSGRVLWSQALVGAAGTEQSQCPTAALPSGVYFLQVIWANGDMQVHKVVK